MKSCHPQACCSLGGVPAGYPGPTADTPKPAPKGQTALGGGTNSGADPYFFSRIALACGAAGFALHAMAEISLYMPASATVFWLAAGGALAVAGTGREVDLSRLRWPAAGAMIVAAVVLAAWLAPPVSARLALTQQMLDAMVVHSDSAAQFAQQAARADPLDPLAANDAARMTLGTCPRGGPDLPTCLDQAHRWAQEAVRRDPTDFANFALLGDIAWFHAYPDGFTYWPLHARADDKAQSPPGAASPPALADRAERFLREHRPADAADLLGRAAELDPASPCLLERLGDAYWLAGAASPPLPGGVRGGEASPGAMEKARSAWQKATSLFTAGPVAARGREALAFIARAVQLNPHDLRLRVNYARRLVSLGRQDECLRQLDHAERVDAAYYPESVSRLSPAERQTVRLLRARCQE